MDAWKTLADVFLGAYALYGAAVGLAAWAWSRSSERTVHQALPAAGGSVSGSSVVGVRPAGLNRHDLYEVSYLADGAKGALRAGLVLAVTQRWLAVEDPQLVTGPQTPPPPVHPLINMLVVRAPGKDRWSILADEELLTAAESHLVETRARLVSLGLVHDRSGNLPVIKPIMAGWLAVEAPAVVTLVMGYPARPLVALMALFAAMVPWILERRPGATPQGRRTLHALKRELAAWRKDLRTRQDVTGAEWALAAGLMGLSALRGSQQDRLLHQLKSVPTDKSPPDGGDGI